MNKKLARILSAALALVMALGTVSVAAAAEPAGTTVLDIFADPTSNVDAKPMLRNWYPDAGAGLTQAQIDEINANPVLAEEFKHDTEYLSLVSDQIRELKAGGYGGVEMTMLSDGASYSYELAKYIAWGSEAWTRVLTQALYTANEIGDFKIDITMTAHWPLIIDTIDPNDDAQQQQMTSYDQEVDPTALEGDYLTLELPEQRVTDYFQGFPGGDSESATFLFVDKLAASNLAVKNADGSLEFDSLTNLTASVVEGAGYAAGVPSTDYIIQAEDGHWMEYTGEGEPTEGNYKAVVASESYHIEIPGEDGKLYDVNGRSYMDDWQNVYQVPVAEIKAFAEANPLEEGQSYVIVNSYCQGTGQVCSGGSALTMDNRNYAVNYYNVEGGKAVTDYWEDNMLYKTVSVYDKDGNAVETTLSEQIKKNDGALFEDSLEMHVTSGVAWSLNIAEDAEEYLGYNVDKYLMLANNYKVSGDDGLASKIKSDLTWLKDTLFNVNHSALISDWSKEVGFKGGYRYQSSNDLIQAENVDIVESDNGTLGNYGLLKSSSTINLRGDQYHSMEGITSTTLDPAYWETILELNMNFSRGINRQIYHGTPFTQSATGIINNWPGWSFNHGNSGYGAWNGRQPLWDNMDTLGDYVTRIQGLLQNSATKIPVLFVGGNAGSFSTLWDYGYHYNVTEEATIMHDYADASLVVDGVLKPDGLATEMVVLSGLNSVQDVAFIDRMIAYADNGMTIALYNTNITAVSGTEKGDNTDAAAAAAFEKLAAHENTITVTSVDEIIAAAQTYIDNPVAYASENIEVTRTVDNTDGTNYYFFYNNKGGDKLSWGGVGQGLSLTGVNGEEADFDVTLDKAENEVVYAMDSYTGEITIVTDYVDNGDGTVTVNMEMAPWDSALLAVSSNVEAFAAAGAVESTKVAYENLALDLSDADWDLNIVSFGPTTDFDETAPFYKTTRSDLAVGTVKLGLWEDLEIPVESLYAIGISADDIENAPTGGGGGFPGGGPGGGPGGPPAPMSVGLSVTDDEEVNPAKYLSGIGYYTTTFNWDGADGAYLYYDHRDDSKTGDAQVNQDMVTEVTVTNEKGTVTFSNLNQMNNRVDLGDALVEGENTITVKLTTTLRNRSKVEGYNNGGCSYSAYGLTAASIVPYEEAVTVSLTGPEAATMEGDLVYGVTVEDASNLATATISVAVPAEPEIEVAEGWYVILSEYADGILTVVMGNNAGVATDEAVEILTLTAANPRKVGDFTVVLEEAVLSAYAGEGEVFLGTVYGNTAVTTAVDYSTYDVNQDGTVNQLDITRAQRFYGTADELADVNDDGEVNIDDLILILNNYSK